MSRGIGVSWSRPRALAVVMMSIGVAGCSADAARFSGGPYAANASTDYTGSVPGQAVPAGRVEQSQLPPPPAHAGAPASGGNRVMVSYTPAPGPDFNGSPRAAPASSRSHTRPAAASSVSQERANTPGVHVVASGDTLSKISHRYKRSVREIARANSIEPDAKLKIGDRLTIPARASAQRSAEKKPAAARSVTVAQAPEQPQPPQSARAVTQVDPVPVAPGAKSSSETGPLFRWPAKGRVIAGFGPKTNGQQNDGINLALPEGTPIKAAEDGVIAYAGNELKGYGNLVLVRHSSGYVTAYAHAKELMVKKGDQIKRGQIIAKSGQTGSVDAPQLHFEVRRGPTPVDPMPLLSGG
jgi:murein DD-endopeptidase MepM/ murein hydrolase activator NlpD